MNKPLSDSDLATPKVTTGPIAGSRKIFSVPEAAPDLRVPLREIPLSEGSGEEPVRVYDPSGVYTDNDAAIDVEKGLKRARIEWVKERGGVEEYDGRPIKDGAPVVTHVSVTHAVPMRVEQPLGLVRPSKHAS